MIQLINRNIGIIGLTPPKRVGLIHIPDTMEPERKNQGIVKYIAPNCKIVELGMHVIFGAYHGNVIGVDDEELIIMDERYITGILDYPKDKIWVSGLYHKSVTTAGGIEYFPATYESSLPLLAAAVQHLSQLAPNRWQEKQGVVDYTRLDMEEGD